MVSVEQLVPKDHILRKIDKYIDFNYPEGEILEEKEITQSTTDPESGLFHKGNHKEVFAYSIQTSCDKNGWILGYKAYPGNLHDSTTFPSFFKEKLEKYKPEKIVMDAGYKIPAIAKEIIRSEEHTSELQSRFDL